MTEIILNAISSVFQLSHHITHVDDELHPGMERKPSRFRRFVRSTGFAYSLRAILAATVIVVIAFLWMNT